MGIRRIANGPPPPDLRPEIEPREACDAAEAGPTYEDTVAMMKEIEALRAELKRVRETREWETETQSIPRLKRLRLNCRAILEKQHEDIFALEVEEVERKHEETMEVESEEVRAVLEEKHQTLQKLQEDRAGWLEKTLPADREAIEESRARSVLAKDAADEEIQRIANEQAARRQRKATRQLAREMIPEAAVDTTTDTHPGNATAPPENATAPPENATAPPENATAPPENATAPEA